MTSVLSAKETSEVKISDIPFNELYIGMPVLSANKSRGKIIALGQTGGRDDRNSVSFRWNSKKESVCVPHFQCDHVTTSWNKTRSSKQSDIPLDKVAVACARSGRTTRMLYELVVACTNQDRCIVIMVLGQQYEYMESILAEIDKNPSLQTGRVTLFPYADDLFDLVHHRWKYECDISQHCDPRDVYVDHAVYESEFEPMLRRMRQFYSDITVQKPDVFSKKRPWDYVELDF